jgi:hypothetical protein
MATTMGGGLEVGGRMATTTGCGFEVGLLVRRVGRWLPVDEVGADLWDLERGWRV